MTGERARVSGEKRSTSQVICLFVYPFVVVSTIFLTHEVQLQSPLIMFIKFPTTTVVMMQSLSVHIKLRLVFWVFRNESVRTHL